MLNVGSCGLNDNDSDYIKIAYVNVQCLRTKFNLLSCFVHNVNMSVLCISEHWLTQGEAEFYGTLENLVLVNGFYRSEHKNEEVAIYADKNLNSM